MTASTAETESLRVFQSLRHELVALAYRMLGDAARAEDMVQEAWLRWSRRDVDPDSPRAFLVTVVTRLCLNELASARSRNEESRSNRLPEPVDLRAAGMAALEAVEQVSMAFLVALERLTPAERAVLLLHEVFDFTHEEIAPLIARTPATSRKLLERARRAVAEGRKLVTASREEHAKLLAAFVRAARAGDSAALLELLASDAVLVTDGGEAGARYGRFHNLPAPLTGAPGIAHFVAAVSQQPGLDLELRELNGRAAAVLRREDSPFAALLMAVNGHKIHRLYFHADVARLRFLGTASGA
jgi:RNA polymerase sigma-70 factor (ECF subfamily)